MTPAPPKQSSPTIRVTELVFVSIVGARRFLVHKGDCKIGLAHSARPSFLILGPYCVCMVLLTNCAFDPCFYYASLLGTLISDGEHSERALRTKKGFATQLFPIDCFEVNLGVRQ